MTVRRASLHMCRGTYVPTRPRSSYCNKIVYHAGQNTPGLAPYRQHSYRNTKDRTAFRRTTGLTHAYRCSDQSANGVTELSRREHSIRRYSVACHSSCIICNDACGEVVEVGDRVSTLYRGDMVAPTIDTKNITGRETERSWLAADEDGVLADYIIFNEKILSKLPTHLTPEEACTIPCAGVTACRL